MIKIQLKPLHFYLVFASLYLGFVLWQPDSGYDKYFWMDWARDIALNGLGAIYHNPEVNYHPFILYLLKIYNCISASDIPEEAINAFKSIVIIFDFATLALIVWLLNKWKKSLLWVLVFLLNPAFWYNTIVWGQTDVIHTFFVFAAFVSILNRQSILSILLFLLALNTKMQAIIFLPLFVLIAYREGKRVNWLKVFASVALLQFLILWPFIFSGNLVISLKAIAGASVDQYPVLSRNAYNIWYLLFHDPFNMPDNAYKYLGIGFFVVLYGVIAWQFLKKYKSEIAMRKKYEIITISAALVTLVFFYINTQMHERYVHSAVLFLGIFSILKNKWWLYVLVSVAYLINLENVMHFAKHVITAMPDNYSINPILISILFLCSIVACFFQLFRLTTNSK